jgi:hypothetical protein
VGVRWSDLLDYMPLVPIQLGVESNALTFALHHYISSFV